MTVWSSFSPFWTTKIGQFLNEKRFVKWDQFELTNWTGKSDSARLVSTFPQQKASFDLDRQNYCEDRTNKVSNLRKIDTLKIKLCAFWQFDIEIVYFDSYHGQTTRSSKQIAIFFASNQILSMGSAWTTALFLYDSNSRCCCNDANVWSASASNARRQEERTYSIIVPDTKSKTNVCSLYLWRLKWDSPTEWSDGRVGRTGRTKWSDGLDDLGLARWTRRLDWSDDSGTAFGKTKYGRLYN